MKWLINYIRSCFCDHDWEHIHDIRHIEYEINAVIGYTKIYRCKKCGYVQKIKM